MPAATRRYCRGSAKADRPLNTAAIALCASVVVGALSAALTLISPRQARPVVAGGGTMITGSAAVITGAAALAGQSFSVTWDMVLPLAGIAFALDPMGGLFVCVTGAVAAVAGLYAIGYSSPSGGVIHAALPLFVVTMVLVPIASSVSTLLLCWELMALTSLLLVLAEHQQRTEVRSAALWYAAMTHMGFVAILIGLLIFAATAGGESFAMLRTHNVEPFAGGLIFTMTLVGFASKAGIVPLHAWLPRAHPEAPSHVSALMSAAMVSLGVYGLVRIGFDLLSGGPAWWWLLVLALGAVSAIYGILQAAMDADMKRLLGNSTSENMGLVLIGIGAAGLFASAGHHRLAGLALAAALLHVVNHAAFKTLLFLAAGSVLRGTATRDLDALGGLRTTMPATSAFFGLGALAASALPPGTAFVSEWLLLQALIHGLPTSGIATAVAMPLAVAAVALTAGLAVATFVKAFGVGFLARPRSSTAANASESPPVMHVAMGLAGIACVVLALMPTVVLPAVGAASTYGTPAEASMVNIDLTAVTGSLSPLFIGVALVLGAVVVICALRAVTTHRVRRAARLWDCGAGPLSSRMEYTATSFAEPLQRVFDNVVQPETDIDVSHYDETSYLVRAVEYRRRVPDRIERRLYGPVLAALRRVGRASQWLATGSVHRYLGFGFITLCVALALLVIL